MKSLKYRLIPIVSDFRIQSENFAIFDTLLATIRSSDDRLRENYTLNGMDLTGHLCLDLLTSEGGDPVAFSGLYNGGRFPERVFRALNRTYVHPAFRATGGVYVNWNSRFILPDQLKRFSDRIGTAFVSRERPEGRGFLDVWSRKWAPESGWRVSDNLVCINPRSRDGSAYQHIARKDYQSNAWKPDEMTPEEWSRLHA